MANLHCSIFSLTPPTEMVVPTSVYVIVHLFRRMVLKRVEEEEVATTFQPVVVLGSQD